MLGKTRIGKYSQQDSALTECYAGWNEKKICEKEKACSGRGIAFSVK
jgi:hypothetical protein